MFVSLFKKSDYPMNEWVTVWLVEGSILSALLSLVMRKENMSPEDFRGYLLRNLDSKSCPPPEIATSSSSAIINEIINENLSTLWGWYEIQQSRGFEALGPENANFEIDTDQYYRCRELSDEFKNMSGTSWWGKWHRRSMSETDRRTLLEMGINPDE